MLVSHEHKFIYIKTAKTASTSTEISVSRYCTGPDDIITPVDEEGEAIRRKMGVYPRNYLADWNEYGLYDYWKLLARGRRKRRFSGHLQARQIRALLPAEVWETYFKFTFDRNPWDKTVSNYFWRCSRDRKPMNLDEFLERYRGKFQHYNFPYYSIDGKVIADFIGRYEQLTEDIGYALSQVGVEFDGWMPNAKGYTRTDRRHYSEILNERQQRFIADEFREEIAVLGYEFESKRAA